MINLHEESKHIYCVSIDIEHGIFHVSFGTIDGITHAINPFSVYSVALENAKAYLNDGRVRSA